MVRRQAARGGEEKGVVLYPTHSPDEPGDSPATTAVDLLPGHDQNAFHIAVFTGDSPVRMSGWPISGKRYKLFMRDTETKGTRRL